MTAEQVILVKNSWKKLKNINSELIGDLFYCKLFYDNPKLKKMFPENMQQQNKKLVDMLHFIVAGIENFHKVKNIIADMAVRHRSYGAKPEHYEMVGAALLWTLEKALITEWNCETKNAWIACYTLLSKTMMDATKKVV